MASVQVIAEIGVNHNGDFNIAKQLVTEASDAGADIIKFQVFDPTLLASETAPQAPYQSKNANIETSNQRQMLQHLYLDHERFEDLANLCGEKGSEFLATAFDDFSFNLIEPLLKRIKVSSGEITNIPLLRKYGASKKPVLVSTGICGLSEIEAAINELIVAGTPEKLITLMHCTSSYPANFESLNLKAIGTLKAAFGLPVGYSDHSVGFEVAIAAVALGATVIEKHITLDKNMIGPDHSASANIGEFSTMVDCIRNIESALGTGIKRPTSSELENSTAIRKSIVAARAIRKGEIFTPECICTKRPGSGITADYWDFVLGRVALRDFAIDEFIEL